MLNVKKILYPTDFSKHSLAALPYAKDLTEKFSAELHCLHVVDEAFQYWMAGSDNAVPIVVSDDELMEAARRQMDQFVQKHWKEPEPSITTSLQIGRPFLEIIHYAKENQIDLIIIATHGRGALASMLLGSVAEKVVRKAPCPVLTVRHTDHQFEMPSFHRISDLPFTI